MKLNKKFVLIITILILIVISIVTIILTKSNCSTSGLSIKNGVIEKYTGNNTMLKTPSNVTKIASDAFSSDIGHAKKLETIVITGNVKTIQKRAFMFGKVNTIIMEEGVEKIENSAFADTYNLKRVVLPSTIEKIANLGVFSVEEHREEKIEYICLRDSYACSFYLKNINDMKEEFILKEVSSIEKYRLLKECD